MSNINTNSISTTFPTPGVNNSTQGFRDNFSNIKLALDTTKSELNDLQSKVVVKSALTGAALNNDMANTIISNAVTKTFRASTFNIGSNLTGQIVIDTTKGDVQYGTVTGDVQFDFSKWAPAGTEAQVKLRLKIDASAATANVIFPTTSVDSQGVITAGTSKSIRILENYVSNGYPHVPEDSQPFQYTNGFTIPNGVSEINLTVTSVDCGTTIDVMPTNRSTTASTIEVRQPSRTGLQGDRLGHICTDGTYFYICTGTYDGSTTIWKRAMLSTF